MTATFDDRVADLQRRLDEALAELQVRTAELDDSEAQKAAMAEVLEIINSSAGDPDPVFEAILKRAHDLCGAELGVLLRYDGECYWPLAAQGTSPRFLERIRHGFRPGANNPFARVLQGERFVQIPDVAEFVAQGVDDPELQIAVEMGIHTFVVVPLRKDDRIYGAFSANRRVIRPLTDYQIALLQSFAAQAVIAMENARLLGELHDRTDDLQQSLEYQTATSDVLNVISRSTFDLQPVLDTIVETATHLCDADSAAIAMRNGEIYRYISSYALDDEYYALLRQQTIVPGRDTIAGRVLLEGGIVHVPDIATDAEYAYPEALTVGKNHTMLGVPLLREGVVIGAIVLPRQRVEPFAQRQIELVRTFADQAVIAIENTRLITETREALAQQTATAEVLGVINSSPGDPAPVFDAMLEKALRLCAASCGTLQSYDGKHFHVLAVRGPSEFENWGRHLGPLHPEPGTTLALLAQGERVVQVADMAQSEGYQIGAAYRREMVDIGGFRTILSIALHKDDVLVGALHLYRQEVRPFIDKQIALLQNFAAQAVIAMENARLITETREALEQQTATAEVLGVINSSPGDLAPVFDAMLERAMRLCGASQAHLLTLDADGERVHPAAARGDPRFAEWLRKQTTMRVVPGSAIDQLRRGERVVHMLDATKVEPYRHNPWFRELIDRSGGRTILNVPLRKDHALLGTMHLYRSEVRAFGDREISLLENFAAQAVIAMESARLITETREALEQQTATAEVLQVINSSPGDVQPVFDAMLEKATRLCEATHGQVATYDGQFFRFIAAHGEAGFAEGLLALGPRLPETGHTWSRIVGGMDTVHVPNVCDSELYRSGHAETRRFVDVGGGRSLLTVALRKDAILVGALTIYRREVRPFSDKQIALLENFAAQAVIAMENARLITETREALDQQTATAEVLQVINSSPGDLGPVFDAMLEKATTLCEAVCGVLWTYDGQRFQSVALRGAPPEFAEFLREPIESGPGTGIGRLISGDSLVHVTDLAAMPTYASGDLLHRAGVELGGVRSLVVVPLRNDAGLVGAFAIYRQEVRPFTEKQIALLQNFAAQAVIAMENARLLDELRQRTGDLEESLEYQTATSDVLKVISRSTFDLQPVLDTLLQTASRLCDDAEGALAIRQGDVFRYVATVALTPEFDASLRQRSLVPDRGSTLGRVVLKGGVVHIADIAADPEYALPEVLTLGKIRTTLGVPLVREGETIGAITLAHRRVEPFTERQIALVSTFADQAVIAMENARLLGEIRQRQQELRVTFDNMVDGVAMFDETLHLAAWNRNFQELIELSDGFLAEPHDFDGYIRYLTARGEFGNTDPETQIKRLRARLGDHYSFERVRPDGKVIEIRNNPMPDGGVVVIYSDITERKRSEAEIRAARDAAEATLNDLRAAQANLVQAEKMASLGQLTAGIAHEIKNPLNFVNNFAGLSVELLDELKEAAGPAIGALDEDKRVEIDETIEMLTGNLEKIAEHGRRADNIVKSMLEHSRGVSGERREVDLNGLIDEALNLAYHGARAQDQTFNITMERDFDRALRPIELAPQEITRVFLNLFGNGFYAANTRARGNGDGAFRPILTVMTRDLGDAVEVRVRDNGTGVPDEIKDKLFQPFFTTKPTGQGTGLGLSISYDIVTQQHGGTIEVESEPGAFTKFTVRLPRQ